jgi:1-acyl-sn-glycerol-3-phosphate acyltransferase
VIRIAVSVFVWAATALLLVLYLPFMGAVLLATRRSDPARRVVGRMFRSIGGWTIGLNPYWTFRLENRSTTPFHEPSVVVSNHESEADIFLSTLLPWDLKYLAKDSIYDTPVMGWGMKMAGDIGVVRGDRRSGVRALIECRKRLALGVSVIIFPEGTRSRTDEMLPFKDGAFRLAVDLKVPVQPVALAGTRYALPPGTMLLGRSNAIIRILEPEPTEGLTSADVPALTERVRARIAQARAEMREELGLPA